MAEEAETRISQQRLPSRTTQKIPSTGGAPCSSFAPSVLSSLLPGPNARVCLWRFAPSSVSCIYLMIILVVFFFLVIPGNLEAALFFLLLLYVADGRDVVKRAPNSLLLAAVKRVTRLCPRCCCALLLSR